MTDEVQIALFGFIATVLVAGVSQWMQSKRERKRLTIEVDERKSDRIYEHRRNAYYEFASIYLSIWNAIWEHLEVDTNSPPPPDDALEPVFDKLTDIRLFGTFEAYELARDATDLMVAWLFGGLPKGKKPPNGSDVFEGLQVFLDQARVDLGAEVWPKKATE